MAVRPDLVGATEEPVEFAWTHDDTMLYAVAVGAGQYDPLAASPRSATATPAGSAPWRAGSPSGCQGRPCSEPGRPLRALHPTRRLARGQCALLVTLRAL